MAHDVLPTVAEILDISIPWKVAGYPAGDGNIDARDDKKVYFPQAGKMFSHQTGGEHSFSDKEHFPDFASRRIGALRSAENPLLSLNRELELDQFFDRETKEFAVERGGHALVQELSVLENVPAERAPIGVVMGNVETETAADKVLIAVNGRFVTGSPLLVFQNVKRSFIALLPESVVAVKKEIGVYLTDGNKLWELDVR